MYHFITLSQSNSIESNSANQLNPHESPQPRTPSRTTELCFKQASESNTPDKHSRNALTDKPQKLQTKRYQPEPF